MKNLLIVIAGLALVSSLAGCAKPPQEEITGTKAAIEAAAAEGSAKYVAEDNKKVNDEYAAAMEEIKVQEAKWFKNYDKAKQLLAQAKTDADALKAKTATVKEELKQKAIAALGEATAAVTGAKAKLEKAPKGKGSAADIEAMKADAAGMEAELVTIQPLVDQGEFVAAAEKAASIRDRANAISTQIDEAAAMKAGKKK